MITEWSRDGPEVVAGMIGRSRANFRTCCRSTLACEVEGARFALSLDKIGCGSEISKIKQAYFCYFARLSLSFNKIGCTSE